jgi:hypothetical protein
VKPAAGVPTGSSLVRQPSWLDLCGLWAAYPRPPEWAVKAAGSSVDASCCSGGGEPSHRVAWVPPWSPSRCRHRPEPNAIVGIQPVPAPRACPVLAMIQQSPPNPQTTPLSARIAPDVGAGGAAKGECVTVVLLACYGPEERSQPERSTPPRTFRSAKNVLSRKILLRRKRDPLKKNVLGKNLLPPNWLNSPL